MNNFVTLHLLWGILTSHQLHLYNCLQAYDNYFFCLGWRRLLRIVCDVLGNACNATTFTGCNLLGHVHVSPYKWEHRAAQFPSELEQPTSSNIYGVHRHKTCLSHCWNAVCAKSNSVSLVVDTQSGESIIIACHTVERCWSKIIFCLWFFNDDLRNTTVAISVHLLFFLGQGSFFVKVCRLFIIATFLCKNNSAFFVLFSLWHQKWNAEHHAGSSSRYSTSNVEGHLIRVWGIIDKTWKGSQKYSHFRLAGSKIGF